MFRSINRVAAFVLLLACWTTVVPAQIDHSRPKVALLFEANETTSAELVAKAAAPFQGRMDIVTLGIPAGSTALPQGIDLKSYDLVVDALGPTLKALGPQIDKVRPQVRVLNIDAASESGDVILSHPDWPALYWQQISVENLANLFRLVESDVFRIPDSPANAPIIYPDQAFYHPGAPGFFRSLAEFQNWYRAPAQARYGYTPARCTIGVLFYMSYYMQANLGPFDAVLEQIETHGCNAVALMTRGAPHLAILREPDGTPFTDVLLYNGERLNLHEYASGTDEANQLGVPLLALDLDYRQTRLQYLASPGGLAPGMSGALTDAEQDGVFEPLMIGSRGNPHDPNAKYDLVPEQIRWRVDRAAAWARLHRLPNAQKRVVMTYWSEGGGKADVGGDPDEFLNVPASAAALLRSMKGAGYNVGAKPLPDGPALAKELSEKTSNVGTWAPGDLQREVEHGHTILVPEAEYASWFTQLPAALRASVVQQWGPPPGNVMVYTRPDGRRFLVLPAMQFGNILVAAHPDWGYEQSRQALMSTGALPPHHQYLAFFLWLQHAWKADAWVSLFTNITLEPGKSEGPYVEDATGVLLGNIPHIHPELLEAGAGIANRRKALALTAGWFRGAVPTHAGALYETVRSLAEAIASDSSVGAADPRSQELRDQIRSAGLDDALEGKLGDESPQQTARNVIAYLDELEQQVMPHGSHVLGDMPASETLVQTVLTMMAPDLTSEMAQRCPADCLVRMTRSVVLDKQPSQQAIVVAFGAYDEHFVALMDQARRDAEKIAQGGREIGAILDALDGRRVPPGPADDPLVQPDALPAGRSLYSFDAAALPTQAAEVAGAKAAEATIAAFRSAHQGAYPTKLAFVLWSSELSANGGVTEAEIFSLLGVRLVRNARHVVTGVALIPRSEMTRPRIDVLATASGLYRDHYQNQLDLIQQGVLLAQASPEPDNPVRKDTAIARAEIGKANPQAANLAQLSSARVFAPAPNAYSPSIQFLAKSGDLRGDENTMAQLFTGKMGHMYGNGAAGEAATTAFQSNLAQMQVATLPRSGQVNGLLDNSMPAAFLGGLNQAAKAVNGGHDSDLYIDSLQDAGHPVVETASHVIQRELQSKYLNPAWIKTMQGSGYDGARYMSQMTDSLSLWSATAKQSVDSDTWEGVKQVYVDDKYRLGMAAYFEQKNPYARQVMLGTLLEAAMHGYWHATSAERAALSSAMARLIAVHGLAGSADINRNTELQRMIEDSVRTPTDGQVRKALQAKIKAAATLAMKQPARVPLPNIASPQPNAPSTISGTVLQEVVPPLQAQRSRTNVTILFFVCALAVMFLIGWCLESKTRSIR